MQLAAWNKYPNDHSPQVINIDILNRYVDKDTGVLHTERLFTCKQNLPSILEWVRPHTSLIFVWSNVTLPPCLSVQIVGKDAVCHIRETTEVDPEKKTMVMRAKNLTYSNLITVEEVCTYSEHVPEESTYVSARSAPLY